MTKPVILDASAILAFLMKEPGAEVVEKRLSAALVSALNYSEVATCLLRRGMKYQDVITVLDNLGLHVVPFDDAQALVAAALDPQTARKGLSLGDRACLALAKASRLPVLTGDRAWKPLDLGIKIIEFR